MASDSCAIPCLPRPWLVRGLVFRQLAVEKCNHPCPVQDYTVLVLVFKTALLFQILYKWQMNMLGGCALSL
jgi:hypothetical protein